MWTPKLFQALAALSHAGTTLSSFTVAGDVRRGLADAGFKVSKQAGFGRKREMLTAVFEADETARPTLHCPTSINRRHRLWW